MGGELCSSAHDELCHRLGFFIKKSEFLFWFLWPSKILLTFAFTLQSLQCTFSQLLLKTFTFIYLGHTTMQMLQTLMANLDLIGVVRGTYHPGEPFNIHPTSRHCEQDPFPEQIKAMSFILASKFLNPDTTRQAVEKYGCSRSVSSSDVDAYTSGKKKVKDNFNKKLFSLFGVLNIDEEEGRDSY